MTFLPNSETIAFDSNSDFDPKLKIPMTKKPYSRLAALLFLSCIAFTPVALAQSASPPTLSIRPKPAMPETVLPTEDTVNSFLFQTFGYDAAITWKIESIRPSEVPGLAEVVVVVSGPQGQGVNHILVSSDGKHAISGDILPFGAHPFDDARAKLEKGINGPARGPAKAPVTIVEFTDMQCPHCQKAAPVVEQLIAQEPDARFVFQNFPLSSHNWADKAAGYVDCLGRLPNSDKVDAPVWKFIEKTFADQANITAANADEKLKAIVTASGANADEIAACAAKPETRTRIEASIALGRSVGVNGTPIIFINGRMIGGGAPADTMKKIVDFQAGQEKGEAEKAKK
jgi:protein-disulfide isomerase